jgi:hypothetical protein
MYGGGLLYQMKHMQATGSHGTHKTWSVLSVLQQLGDAITRHYIPPLAGNKLLQETGHTD